MKTGLTLFLEEKFQRGGHSTLSNESDLSGIVMQPPPPLEIVFLEQRYSCLHSGRNLARGHFHCIIADPCFDWRTRGADTSIGDSADADANHCVTN